MTPEEIRYRLRDATMRGESAGHADAALHSRRPMAYETRAEILAWYEGWKAGKARFLAERRIAETEAGSVEAMLDAECARQNRKLPDAVRAERKSA